MTSRTNASATGVDVLGIGENSIDLVFRIPGPLVPGGKHPLTAARQSPGGQVATALCTCAALGLRTAYVGAFGTDDSGRLVRERMAAAGVDVTAAHGHPVRNRRAVIIVDEASGGRTILWERDRALGLHPDVLDHVDVAAARALHVDATDLDVSLAAAALARTAGRIVTADIDTPGEAADALLRAATHPILAEGVPEAMSGEPDLDRALRSLRRPHHAMIGVTLGARGAALLAGDILHRASPPRVEAVDTTGAGDVFRGAFICALLRGDTPEEILRFANAAAALSCTREGAIDSVPALADVTRVLNS